MTEIIKVTAREILDSRANPTVEAEITLSDGTVATAEVPSGASTGKYEARELRDNDKNRYRGKGVLTAVRNINEIISPALIGMNALDIDEADAVMLALDGSYNKSNLGANSILAVSLALARAGAESLGIPLYRYLGGALVGRMPVPMMNIINGGLHADNNLDLQEFMIVPVGAESFSDAVRSCAEVYHTLKEILISSGMSASVGDEGGFAPTLSSDEEAIEVILRAIERSGYKAGEDFMIALDVASSEWYSEGKYILPKRKVTYTSDELIEYLEGLVSKYPIMSIEDAVGEDDLAAWKEATARLRGRVMLVGDDLFATSRDRIDMGIREGIATAVLIKPNQAGSLTETVSALTRASRSGYKTVVSHRSADTSDTFIADLAVAFSSDFIKTGAPARAERSAKYNRLMKIESELFDARYG